MSRKGRRFDDEPRLNIKKVIATLIALFVFVMIIVSIVMMFNKKEVKEVVNVEYFSLLSNNKWGVINSNGDVVIEAKYDEMIIIPDKTKDIFIYNSNVNYKDETYETKVINAKGEELFSNYHNVEPLDNYTSVDDVWYEKNSLKYEKNGKYGLIDYSGNEILPPEYTNIYTLKGLERSIIVDKDGKLGLYNDVSKDMILEPVYLSITALGENYNDGYIVKNEENKFGIVGPDKKVILDISYDAVGKVHGDSIYVVKKEGKNSLVDKNGNVIFDLKKDETISEIADKNIIMMKDKKYGIVNDEKKEIVKIKYDELSHGYGNYYIAKSGDKYGVIDVNGDIKIKFKYTGITYEPDAAIFECENKDLSTDLYNNFCEYKLKGTVSEINSEKSYMRIRVDDEYKYYNLNFEERTNKDVLTGNTLFLVKEDGKYGFVNKDGQKIVDCIYDDATEQNEYGFCAIQKNGKWGSIKSDGTIVLEPSKDLSDNIIINFIGKYHLDTNNELNAYTD